MVQAALVCTLDAEQLLDRGRVLDLGSERCASLFMATITARKAAPSHRPRVIGAYAQGNQNAQNDAVHYLSPYALS